MPSLLQILAIVAMSYDELQKKAEEEEEAALAEEEALRVSDSNMRVVEISLWHRSPLPFMAVLRIEVEIALSAPSLYKVVRAGERSSAARRRRRDRGRLFSL